MTRIVRLLGLAAVVLGLAAVVTAVAGGVAASLAQRFFFQTAFFAVAVGLVGAIAAHRGSVNRGVALTTTAAFIASCEVVGVAISDLLLADRPDLVAALAQGTFAPADLPRAAASWLWFERSWLLSLGGFLSIGLLLFPDGRLPSRRWRAAVGLAVVGLASFTVVNVVIGAPSSTVPWSVSTGDGNGAGDAWIVLSIRAGFILTAASIVLAVVSLIVRHRRAGPDQRHQVRWMATGVGFFAVAFVITFVGTLGWGVEAQSHALNVVSAALIVPGVGLSYGMGILKHRLYEIDTVINRSIVFGLLAGFITLVYVAVVVGVGSAIGDPGNLGLAIMATALVAVLFEPARERVQHQANVWVYGRRATPYEVLAGMSADDRGPDRLLDDALRLLGEATGSSHAAVLAGTGERRLVAAWSADGTPVADGNWSHEVMMYHEDEPVGAVAILSRRGDHLTGTDERLVAEFGGNATLLLANVLLRERLAERIVELDGSRRRLMGAQDEARRRLERDLHDGAQQELVALKVKLGLAARMARTEGAERVAELLAGVSDDADSAVQQLRDLARGIYPPLLEADGLVAAITAHARTSPIPVSVQGDGVGRCPRTIEATVYFTVLEAITNAVKHSAADAITVTLESHAKELRFSIVDDGSGFESHGTAGSGLAGITDRVEAAGGVIAVESRPGRGTRVSGRLPVEVGRAVGSRASPVPA